MFRPLASMPQMREKARRRAQIEFAVGDLSRAVELDPADRASADCFDRARRQLAEWGR
jgi:hypothetical protein